MGRKGQGGSDQNYEGPAGAQAECGGSQRLPGSLLQVRTELNKRTPLSEEGGDLSLLLGVMGGSVVGALQEVAGLALGGLHRVGEEEATAREGVRAMVEGLGPHQDSRHFRDRHKEVFLLPQR